jgi:hypothetical protein
MSESISPPCFGEISVVQQCSCRKTMFVLFAIVLFFLIWTFINTDDRKYMYIETNMTKKDEQKIN